MTIKIQEKFSWDSSKAYILMVNDDASYDVELLEKLLDKTKTLKFETNKWTTLWGEDLCQITFIDTGNIDENEAIIKMVESIRAYQKMGVKELYIDAESMIQKADNKRRAFKKVVENAYLASYEGYTLKSDVKDGISGIEIRSTFFEEKLFEEAMILSEMTQYSRNLVNTPANLLTPSILASKVEDLGQNVGFDVDVLDVSKIRALKMDAFLSVSKGSMEEPKLIVMRYKGGQDSKTFGLVGKGLTYDSGGYSIKPTSSMINMKNDMGGAAAVIGAMGAIAKMKLSHNVIAVVAACENMISGSAYKPGDIVQSMGGKTIYVGNTDAEGRLTLVDAIHYIQEIEKVDMLVDIATLTGAAMYAFGNSASPIVANDDTISKLVEKSFAKSNELMWPMPNLPEYHKQVKHELADLNNSAGRPGVMTASAFLEAFVYDIPWVHIDIASTALLDKVKGEKPAGATGIGVRGLYQVIKKISK